MEADWEFEAGSDAPVIEAFWPGFVDLRWSAQPADDYAARFLSLAETAQLSALARALEKLNSENSPVWTSKCDFWPALTPGEFDADELDAPAGSIVHAVGCYIDLLPKNRDQWQTPEAMTVCCRALCARLHSTPLRCCRVDLIVRRALIDPSQLDLGITVYITASGPTPVEAIHTLEASVAELANAFCPQSTLQW